jgi:CHAP domain
VIPENVREFQRAHVDVFDRPLSVDGAIGPATQWALDLFSCSPRRRAVVSRAQSALGVTEEPPGSNRGPRIDEWLQRCHVSTGLPWCAAFASWCLDTVAIAGAQALGGHFPAVDSPLPGDVMWFATGASKGHCGVVVGLGPHEVMTIEGNCHDSVRVVRRARDQVRFSSTGGDIQGTCPSAIAKAPFMATTLEGTR